MSEPAVLSAVGWDAAASDERGTVARAGASRVGASAARSTTGAGARRPAGAVPGGVGASAARSTTDAGARRPAGAVPGGVGASAARSTTDGGGSAATRPRAGSRGSREAAAELPVAQVLVDMSLAHLDHVFDYLVPASLDDAAQPGVRVRVRFAGQLLDGFVVGRAEKSDTGSTLRSLERVVSPVPVLTPEVARLGRAVADRYAGTLADVLRLAIPPRHAQAESAALARPAGRSASARTGPKKPSPGARPEGQPDATAEVGAADLPSIDRLASGWRAYPQGSGFVRALGEGRAARAVWTALPGEDWPARIAEALAATLHAGRGALAVVADARDLDRLDRALHRVTGPSRHATLAAAAGPAERYTQFLAAAGGEVRVVVGNRAASFAPVADIGLVAIWDDGDDLHAEPRAPYPHAREVLLTRAQQAGAAALIGGFGRTAEATQLLESGWAHEIVAARETIRARAPRVEAIEDDEHGAGHARLPDRAMRAAREALGAGHPVLVQVPRRGYLPSVACAACRRPARCSACHGPLSLPGAAAPATCRWCARPAASWECATCGGRRLRASIIGAARTAEEFGRAFPDVPVRTSGRGGVLASVPPAPALVIATPGAEPFVDRGGYGAVLLLDSWALLSRADLRAGEEALRRWLAAAALAMPAERGGTVVVVADPALASVQALVRFDPGTLAIRDLAERRELGFPPAVRMASLTGTPAAVAELIAATRLPAGAEILGPVPAAAGRERFLVRVPRREGTAFAAALGDAQAVRSARKAPDPVRVQIDPLELV